jgi:hypothetical protein
MVLIESFVTDISAPSARVRQSQEKTEDGTGTWSRNVCNTLPTKARNIPRERNPRVHNYRA